METKRRRNDKTESRNETELVIKNGRRKTEISERTCKLHDRDRESVNNYASSESASKSFKQPGRERQRR